MEENKPNQNSEKEPKVETTESNYLEALEKMKKDSVSKELYEKAVSENKKLMDMYLNDRNPAPEDSGHDNGPRPLKELIPLMKEVNNETINLDYWKLFHETRQAFIKEKGFDPCVTHGQGPNGKIEPEYGEAEAVEENMKIIQELIDACDGDPNVFQNSFSRAAR